MSYHWGDYNWAQKHESWAAALSVPVSFILIYGINWFFLNVISSTLLSLAIIGTGVNLIILIDSLLKGIESDEDNKWFGTSLVVSTITCILLGAYAVPLFNVGEDLLLDNITLIFWLSMINGYSIISILYNSRMDHFVEFGIGNTTICSTSLRIMAWIFFMISLRSLGEISTEMTDPSIIYLLILFIGALAAGLWVMLFSITNLFNFVAMLFMMGIILD